MNTARYVPNLGWEPSGTKKCQKTQAMTKQQMRSKTGDALQAGLTKRATGQECIV